MCFTMEEGSISYLAVSDGLCKICREVRKLAWSDLETGKRSAPCHFRSYRHPVVVFIMLPFTAYALDACSCSLAV